ncbi:WAT1-related protein At5g47470-like isoform X1 [Hibiscus syriacus]|uniref:WAT1-related protein At5g47470-like isoform X1 n=1 Tax=Hibiscus syriacus TaxID=106335 RepID=UPI0019228F16|nr:WAT1-related protein At5g47470-like isoform X1 [Hibiscus syriacus]
MIEHNKRDEVEDVAIYGGLTGVQFVYAGNSVLLGYLMSLGLTPFSIVIFFTSSTFLIVSPFALYFERNKWPKQLTLKLIIQLILISFGGVTLFQSLFFKGINLTSPAVATAMPNLAPGLIFIIAWACRLEKVALSCLYSKVKIGGTLLCVLGALTMSLMHSTVSPKTTSMFSAPTHDAIFDKDKITGCIYLMAAVLVLSTNVVLQAATLGDFPAPMSLCAITSLIGVIITVMVQLVEDGDLQQGWPLLSVKHLLAFSLLEGAVGGACVSFNGWALKKRGPVLVSMFGPIGTVVTVVLSFITLGDTISFGSYLYECSLGGMLVMFTGLYFVLWAKGKEVICSDEDGSESEWVVERSLLC